MPALPEFSFDQTVSAQAGKQDKITLVIGHGSYTQTPEKLDTFRKYLGGPPRGSSALTRRRYSRIFNAAGYRRELEIRKSQQGSAVFFPHPLFAGSYHFTEYREVRDRRDHVTTLAALRLFLNPTRFLRYQNTVRYFPPRRDFSKHAATFYKERVAPETDEIALDGSDNYIPDTNAFQFALDGRLWIRNLRTYIDGVLRTIDRDTCRAEQGCAAKEHNRLIENPFLWGSANYPNSVIAALDALQFLRHSPLAPPQSHHE